MFILIYVLGCLGIFGFICMLDFLGILDFTCVCF